MWFGGSVGGAVGVPGGRRGSRWPVGGQRWRRCATGRVGGSCPRVGGGRQRPGVPGGGRGCPGVAGRRRIHVLVGRALTSSQDEYGRGRRIAHGSDGGAWSRRPAVERGTHRSGEDSVRSPTRISTRRSDTIEWSAPGAPFRRRIRSSRNDRSRPRSRRSCDRRGSGGRHRSGVRVRWSSPTRCCR